MKLEERCKAKIAGDYASQPWPAAASLLDIVRCQIVVDDPYTMAVLVAYLRKEFDVVRVKNRFEHDELEEVNIRSLQAEFYMAEATSGVSPSAKSSYRYRDILVNLRPKGSDLICEVQVMLTGIWILKKSDQLVYTLCRMRSAKELLGVSVFSELVSRQGVKAPTDEVGESLLPGRKHDQEAPGNVAGWKWEKRSVRYAQEGSHLPRILAIAEHSSKPMELASVKSSALNMLSVVDVSERTPVVSIDQTPE